MRTGTLNSRVVVEQQSTTQDALGQPVLTWSTFATLWANIKHTSGIETIKADALTTVTKVSIQVRYRTDIKAAMRVVHGTDVYNIVSVLPDKEAKNFTNLVCELVL